jgi:hypothetical protein
MVGVLKMIVMASVHLYISGRSRDWYAKFRGADGQLIVKSTECSDREKALAIAVEYEAFVCQGSWTLAGTTYESCVKRIFSSNRGG